VQATGLTTATPRPALAPGERYPVAPGDLVRGRYRIEQILGAGAMTVVAVASVEGDGAPLLPAADDSLSTSVAPSAASVPPEPMPARVALKIMREPRMTPESTTRFMADARKMMGLRSAHAPRVLDVGMLVSGLPYLVTELIEGSDLATVLEKGGALPAYIAIEYVLQACDALADAERVGVVHRDVELADLFLTHTAEGVPAIKLLGLGIAKTGLSGDELLGAAQYRSPEQIRAARGAVDDPVDGRSDVWALGAILFQLITGHGPFAGDTTEETIAKVLERPTPALSLYSSDVPRGLSAVVERALEKDRAKRYVAVGIFGLALRELEVKPSVSGVATWHESGALPPQPPAAAASMRGVASLSPASLPRIDTPPARRSWIPIVLVVAALATCGAVGARVMQYRRAAAEDAPSASSAAATTPPASAPPSAPPSAPVSAAPSRPTATAVPPAPAAPAESRPPRKRHPKPKPGAPKEDLPSRL
jgi:serine/threonine-protein kinase